MNDATLRIQNAEYNPQMLTDFNSKTLKPLNRISGFHNGLAILDVNQIEELDRVSGSQKDLAKVPAQVAKGEVPGSFHIDLPASPTHLVTNLKFLTFGNILNVFLFIRIFSCFFIIWA